ncbi:MAG: chromophore lyase CpcT/CpeT [Phycisphaerales bacterium JB065]
MKLTHLLATLAATCALWGCASSSPTPASNDTGTSRLDRLAADMTGSFSSAKQAENDPDYFDIRLEMVEIWPDRDADAVWLYVEQATATALNRPYRQRVYRLSAAGDNQFISAVYELPGDPLAFAGWWRTPERFEGTLSPDDLTELTGCAVTLEFDDSSNTFTGSTGIGTCQSTLRGAAYVVSEVTVYPDRLVTWDRGFDADGEQVWGATSGGYEFIRVD